MNKKLIAGVVAAVAVLAVVLIAVQLLTKDEAPTKAEDFRGADEAIALVAGIPQNGRVLGKENAPVKIVEYIDFKCPFCAQASKTVVPDVIEKYVRSGQATLEVRPIAFLGDDSERGALAAEAAALQDKTWQFTEVLLGNQGDEQEAWITDDVVIAAAEAAGLDRATFEDDYLNNETILDTFVANKDAAEADGLTGTPYFVVTGPGGTERLTAEQSSDITGFDAAIAKVKAGGR